MTGTITCFHGGVKAQSHPTKFATEHDAVNSMRIDTEFRC